MKKRILIVHNYYQILGGEDTVVANEKKMLEEHGHTVFLYTRNNSEINKMNIFRKMFLPFTTIYNPRTAKDIKKIIKEQHIDIIHVHNTLNLISPAVYYVAKKCGIPVVQTVHNFRLLCPKATFYRDGKICEDCVSRGLKCAIKYGCYRNSRLQTLICVISTKIHRLTGIYGKINYICLTEFTKQKLLTLSQIRPQQVFIKPNVVFDFGGNAKPEDYFVYVGRLEEIKGINLLFDAFQRIPDIKLKVIGTGDLEETLKRRIENEHLENIDLLGQRNREEVNKVVHNAKALIMCSQWYETFGMVIVEAYSNGVPVIVGNIGNIKELVINGTTGELFDYNSVNQLIEKIRKLSGCNTAEMGYRGYQYYKTHFAPEINYETLLSIYEKIV